MSDYAYEINQQIDDTDYGYFNYDSLTKLRKLVKKMPFEALLDEYQDYIKRGMWNPKTPFTEVIKWVQYGIALKMELQKRDRKRTVIL